jgi:taurine dioxygenase
MNVELLRPFGARVRELSLTTLDRGQVARLRGLLAWRGVLHFPGQLIDDAGFVAFLRRFGAPAFTVGEMAVPGHPDLNEVSNVGRTSPPRSSFHVDTSYVARPPAYTALRAVMVPEHGGETQFTDQYRAYETLPFEIRARLMGATITHVATGVSLADGDEAEAAHPVFRRHPISDRVALYLSTPARCAAISGLDEPEARDMIAFLYEHSIRVEHRLAHRWAPGDVLMWDNGCVLHRADHSAVTGDRVLHRGMVAGYDDDRPIRPSREESP